MEATAREERYRAVREALESTCSHTGYDLEDASAFTGHTADDRVESYFMRTIVGTGPGGLRAMSHVSWVNGCRICRPLLECSRDELREYIRSRPGAIADELGNLWREDATNGDTDHFRSYVRHELVPRAMERNPQLLATLTRTMNQIADEDDMLIARTKDLLVRFGVPLGSSPREGFIMSPEIGMEPKAMQRRVVYRLLSLMLPPTARIESASVEACVEAIGNHGYVANIQGDIAVSFNKHGLRLEPMAAFRARRNRV
jgi:tRNA(Ile)-lysidine synthase